MPRLLLTLLLVGFLAVPVGTAVSAAATPPVRATRAQPAAPVTEYGWPLAGRPAVSRPFEPPEHRYGPGHRGVDLTGTPGQQVLAAGQGTVVFAAPLAGRGVVSIAHPDGLRTTYEPVRATVRAGDLVDRGEPIGSLRPGHPGCTAPACLHWGARRGDDYLDPLSLLGSGRVRLLPWTDP